MADTERVSTGEIPEIDPEVASGKIQQALTRLGIPFMDAMHLVEYKEDAGTAYWSYNQQTGEEKICVGPTIASLAISSIEMVLRHEFLHRSTYHGFHERFADAQLLNIVEDVCINRLLYEAYPDEMQKLSLLVYSQEAKKTIIALADCSAAPELLTEELEKLWNYIWQVDEFGEYSQLNPSSLYYRLLDLKGKSKIEISFNLGDLIDILAEHAEQTEGGINDAVRKAAEKIISGIGGRLPGTSATGTMMNAYLNTSVQFDQEPIRRFLESIRVDRIVSKSRTDLMETVRYTMNSIISMFPTRKGMIYLTTGISDLMRIYNNQYTETMPKRLKLCYYIDVSGSMESYFRHVHHFVKAIFDIPLEVKVFDTTVTEVPEKDYRDGRFKVGGGTDFDVVMEDLIESDDIGAGLIFTDGQAPVSAEIAAKFKASGKKLFIVYFTQIGESRPRSDLDSFSESILHMPIRN